MNSPISCQHTPETLIVRSVREKVLPFLSIQLPDSLLVQRFPNFSKDLLRQVREHLLCDDEVLRQPNAMTRPCFLHDQRLVCIVGHEYFAERVHLLVSTSPWLNSLTTLVLPSLTNLASLTPRSIVSSFCFTDKKTAAMKKAAKVRKGLLLHHRQQPFDAHNVAHLDKL